MPFSRDESLDAALAEASDRNNRFERPSCLIDGIQLEG
jgi:hypothetical protein